METSESEGPRFVVKKVRHSSAATLLLSSHAGNSMVSERFCLENSPLPSLAGNAHARLAQSVTPDFGIPAHSGMPSLSGHGTFAPVRAAASPPLPWRNHSSSPLCSTSTCICT